MRATWAGPGGRKLILSWSWSQYSIISRCFNPGDLHFFNISYKDILILQNIVMSRLWMFFIAYKTSCPRLTLFYFYLYGCYFCRTYWPDLDGKIREALVLRSVKVRLLISFWKETDPLTFNFISSLKAICTEIANCSLKVVSIIWATLLNKKHWVPLSTNTKTSNNNQDNKLSEKYLKRLVQLFFKTITCNKRRLEPKFAGALPA